MTSDPGRFTLSMDFELGWGVVETGQWRARERAGVYERLRPVMRRTLDMLDTLEIPLTWAAVGGMASPQEALEFDHLPSHLQECSHRFVTEARQSTRDGRDLVDMVRASRVPHDLGSHSFSHARFSAPGYDDAARHHDLTLAQKALMHWGGAPISFIFPENDAASLVPVVQAGLRHVRLAPAGVAATGSLAKLSAKLARPPAAGPVQAPQGLSAETGTMFFHWPLQDRFGLRRRMAMRQSAMALQAAATQGCAIHYWLHPFNLAEIPGLEERFNALMHTVADLRDRGAIRVATIADRADRSKTASTTGTGRG